MPQELPEYIQVDGRARIALESLPDTELTKVVERFDALRRYPEQQWPSLGARRLPEDGSTYVLRVSERLLLFFTAHGDHFRIEDFVRQETLDRYFTPRPTPAEQP